MPLKEVSCDEFYPNASIQCGKTADKGKTAELVRGFRVLES